MAPHQVDIVSSSSSFAVARRLRLINCVYKKEMNCHAHNTHFSAGVDGDADCTAGVNITVGCSQVCACVCACVSV